MATIEIAGEHALIIRFGERMASDIAALVQQATAMIHNTINDQIVDVIPSYTSILVTFNPHESTRDNLATALTAMLESLPKAKADAGRLIELPVCYAEAFAPDLPRIAERSKLDLETIIALHSEREYRCYAIGFAPGFAYLGEVDERIATPRLPTPRLDVPRGAVGIADQQTAIYPAQSPGGWNLIGRCPTRLFDPDHNPPSPVQVGDRIRFRPISRDEFDALEQPA